MKIKCLFGGHDFVEVVYYNDISGIEVLKCSHCNKYKNLNHLNGEYVITKERVFGSK